MTPFNNLSIEEQARVKLLLEQLKTNATFNRIEQYRPMPKQMEFHSLSADYREFLMLGGNRTGKTYCGAAEMWFHLSGRYPSWYRGKRFQHPIRAKAASVNYKMTRDGIQRQLLGPPEKREEWGTAAIAKSCIGKIVMNNAVPGGMNVSSIQVKHVSGGFSYLQLDAYSQGRDSWQADAFDVVWFDEEPPLEIYSEGKTRIARGTGSDYGYPDSKGFVYTTFTPFKGISEVVGGFYPECKTKDKAFVQMGLYDVMDDPSKGIKGIYTKEYIDTLLDGYEDHEREARGFGTPVMGDGAVFNVSWKEILVDPIPIPKHWLLLNGIDFGWAHPMAGVAIAIDPDSPPGAGKDGTIYVVDVVKHSKKTYEEFASIIRTWEGEWAWPHDGNNHEGGGETKAGQFVNHGIKMLHEKATHDGTKSNSLDVSLNECLEMFRSGKLKIFSTAANKGGIQDSLLTELMQYHRIDGKVVPLKDDAIAAMRYAIMMRRYAKAVNDKDDLAQLIRDRNKKKRAGGNYMAY